MVWAGADSAVAATAALFVLGSAAQRERHNSVECVAFAVLFEICFHGERFSDKFRADSLCPWRVLSYNLATEG